MDYDILFSITLFNYTISLQEWFNCSTGKHEYFKLDFVNSLS